MLTVNLTITNNSKAAKLLDLLKELPFVAINDCQETDLQETVGLVRLLEKDQADPERTSRVLGTFGTLYSVALRNTISGRVNEQFGRERLEALYRKLAQHPLPHDVLQFQAGKEDGYCQYVEGFRCLYTGFSLQRGEKLR